MRKNLAVIAVIFIGLSLALYAYLSYLSKDVITAAEEPEGAVRAETRTHRETVEATDVLKPATIEAKNTGQIVSPKPSLNTNSHSNDHLKIDGPVKQPPVAGPGEPTGQVNSRSAHAASQIGNTNQPEPIPFPEGYSHFLTTNGGASVAERHRELELQPRDEAWATQTEAAIAGFLRYQLGWPDSVVQGIHCRSTLCEIFATTNDPWYNDWERGFGEITRSPDVRDLRIENVWNYQSSDGSKLIFGARLRRTTQR